MNRTQVRYSQIALLVVSACVLLPLVARGQPHDPVVCDKRIDNTLASPACTSDTQCFDFLISSGNQTCTTDTPPQPYSACGSPSTVQVDQYRVYGGTCAFNGSMGVCTFGSGTVVWNACVNISVYESPTICDGGEG